MKIAKLVLKNFKGYDHKVITFDDSKVVYATAGENGVGKTSLQQAIRFIITGDAPDNIIKKGELEASVTCVLADGTVIERIKSLDKSAKTSQKLNGKAVTGVILNDYINRTVGALPNSLKLALDPNLLENLKPEQLSDFLIKAIGQDIPLAHVLSYTKTTDEEILNALKTYLPRKEEISIEDIENTYKVIFQERADYKKNIDKLTAKINSVLFERPSESLESVNRKIEAIIKEEGAHEAAKLAIKTYEKAVEGKKKQEEYIKNLEDSITKNTSKKPITSQLDNIRSSKEDLNKQIISISSVIKTMEDTIKTFQDTISKLSSAFCPLSESITCNSIKEREKLKSEFEEQIVAQKEGIAIQQKLLDELKLKVKDLDKKEAEYNANATEYQKKLVLKTQLEEAKKSIPALPTKPKSVPADVEEYAEKKRALENLKNKIMKCDERDKDQASLAVCQKKYGILDALVKMLAPKGVVMHEILTYFMSSFEDMLNERANELRPDFNVKLRLDAGVHIECETRAGKGYVPYESLSAGEKAYVMFLFIDLFADAITQIKIMLLDDLDKLDSNAFDALVKLLTSKEITDRYDHIFIASVNHTDSIKSLSSYSDIDLQLV